MASADGINWSISKLFMYESCPMRFRLKYIDRIPELPPKPDSPLERGNRIHGNLENFLKDKEGGDLKDNEAKRIEDFKPALNHLKELYDAGKATAEDNWFYNYDWEVCDRKNVWLWAKLDFYVFDPDTGLAIVGDYKSGKSAYKAVEHTQQTQLYAAVAAIRNEHVKRVVSELWYVDEGHVMSRSYTAEQAMGFISMFDRRVDRIYQDRVFKPNANAITCKWCPYGPRNGNGQCPVGV